MPALDALLEQKLLLLEHKQQKRTIRSVSRQSHAAIQRGGKGLISFSCNDYLGLSHHPELVAASHNALESYGAGAGASRLITGNCPLYDMLEQQLADYKHTEAACVFGSGYLANMGTIPALVGAGDLIIADKLIHACMIDAAKLSGATLMRFAHNKLEHCQMLLESHRNDYQHCLILTETIFSMDGDCAPLTELAALAERYDATLMTDDAHGLGVLPVSAHPASAIQMGTLSKAAGSYGGYVCGSKILIDYLKTAARSLIYSTALPPAVLAASSKAIELMRSQPELGAKALENARLFTTLLELPEAQSAIVPLILGESEKALAAARLLEEKGYEVVAIRPPTVPENSARLRFTFSAQHQKSDIQALAAIIREYIL